MFPLLQTNLKKGLRVKVRVFIFTRAHRVSSTEPDSHVVCYPLSLTLRITHRVNYELLKIYAESRKIFKKKTKQVPHYDNSVLECINLPCDTDGLACLNWYYGNILVHIVSWKSKLCYAVQR